MKTSSLPASANDRIAYQLPGHERLLTPRQVAQ
jgi:hypothetical protein